MLRNEGDRLKRVIVCSPTKEYALGARDLEKHNIGELGNPEIAIQQHDGLKSALEKYCGQVIDAAELKGHPNSVFVRDTALCTPAGYVKLRLGLESRLGEGDWMADILDDLGEPRAGEIKEPGTVDGGDVILAGNIAFIGRSNRTNAEGLAQLSSILRKTGYEIRVIDLDESILHLDKILMMLGPERVLYCSNWISETDVKGFDKIGIPCGGDTTANIICLGDSEVLVNRSNSAVVDLLAKKGHTIHVLDLSEFAKGMGGPNCLIMPVERGKS